MRVLLASYLIRTSLSGNWRQSNLACGERFARFLLSMEMQGNVISFFQASGGLGSWHLHNLALVPEDGVGVEIRRWIEPEVQSLLSVSNAIHIDVRLNQIGLSRRVSQELEIELVVIWTVR